MSRQGEGWQEIAERERRELEEHERLMRQIGEPEQAVVPEKPALPDTLPKSKDIKELAQAVEPEVFRTYYELMMSDDTPAAVRKSCADALADRARGKVEQAMTQKVEIKRTDISLDEAARMIMFAMRDAQEKGSEFDIIDVEQEDL